MSEYNNVSNRLLVDIDNERPRDFDIVGLTKRGVDYAVNFKNERVLLLKGIMCICILIIAILMGMFHIYFAKVM